MGAAALPTGGLAEEPVPGLLTYPAGLVTLILVTALMGLDARLRMARLLCVTDPRRDSDDLEEFVESVFSGGVDILQLRGPKLKPSRMVAALEVARSAAFHHQGLVVVSDSLEVAKDFTADLLHLPASGDTKAARKVLHQWALIGRTAGTREEIDAALADPEVNYLTIGPVYDAAGKPVNLDLVAHAVKVAPPHEALSKPWFVFGNITAENLEGVIAAGARRVAVSGAITAAADPEAAARKLKDRLRRLWNEDPAMENYIFSVFGMGG